MMSALYSHNINGINNQTETKQYVHVYTYNTNTIRQVNQDNLTLIMKLHTSWCLILVESFESVCDTTVVNRNENLATAEVFVYLTS